RSKRDWSSDVCSSDLGPGPVPRVRVFYLHVIERLTRIDDKTLLYRFTVEDPDTWDRPWTGEYTWPATDKPIYEYACHEGNYALRSEERRVGKQCRDQT